MRELNGTGWDGREPLKVGYVVKRYPRFSETFIVNELLAHEAAGHALEIFSLYPPTDTHFQDLISRVRAPVTYLCAEGARLADFWGALEAAGELGAGFWGRLAEAKGSASREVYQAARLACLVRARGIHHLHAHFGSTATEVARLAAAFAGVRYTFTAHAKDIFHESVVEADLERKLRQAASVVTVSDFNVRHLRSRFGDHASRVVRIYNGMHLDRFPFEAPVQRLPRVVAVGRLVEKKGFDVLVNAAALLQGRGVRFECEIIGSGEQEALLRRQVAALGLERQVRFLGALPQPEVIRHLREAAVFAAPCVVGRDGNADGLPTVLLESMALGTPCVSTDVTGIPEVVRHRETGLIVPQGDAEALANALEQLMGDAVLRCRLASRARELIEIECDAQRTSAELFELFEAAAGRESGGTTDGWMEHSFRTAPAESETVITSKGAACS